jgi:hypothetical protein
MSGRMTCPIIALSLSYGDNNLRLWVKMTFGFQTVRDVVAYSSIFNVFEVRQQSVAKDIMFFHMK